MRRPLQSAPSPQACERGAEANTRWVMAGEGLDGRSVLGACVHHTRSLREPCVAAVTRERSAELGLHKEAHHGRERRDIKVVQAVGMNGGRCGVPALPQPWFGKDWKRTHSRFHSVSVSLYSWPFAGHLHPTADRLPDGGVGRWRCFLPPLSAAAACQALSGPGCPSCSGYIWTVS